MSEEIPAAEKLFRNLHPDDYDNGRINSTAFSPSREHDYKLSLDRSAMVSARQSYGMFTARGNKSIGVCGVHKQDFAVESLPCFPDPLPDNAAHALADYNGCSGTQRRKKGKRLAKIALANGMDYEP